MKVARTREEAKEMALQEALNGSTEESINPIAFEVTKLVKAVNGECGCGETPAIQVTIFSDGEYYGAGRCAICEACGA